MGACFDFSSPLGKINLDSDSEIVFENTFYVYTGEEIKPSVTVKHRDKIVDAENYTLTYSDNVNAGKASVKAVGVGDYIGSVSATFDIGYQYTFNVNGADKVDGETLQAVASKDLITPPTVEKTGYEFLYWTLDSQPVDFDDVANLPSSGEFVANYVATIYHITYNLDGATNDSNNLSEYTVEDYFTLKDAKLSGMQFAGWYLDSEHKERITSLEGYSRNLNLYAKFVDYTAKTIEYRVPDGANEVATDLFMPEENVEYLNSQYAQTKEIDGALHKLVWYADGNYSTRYFFREMPNENLVVYAQWEEVLRAGFLGYADEFMSDNVSIDSFEELVAYIDYVCYFNIVSRIDRNNRLIDVNEFVSITYKTRPDDIRDEISNALIATTYPRMAAIGYECQNGGFKIALTQDNVKDGREASMYSTDEDDFTPQIGNIFALKSNGRDDGFDKFPIDFVEDAFEVETSNQLFYILSHGYRPLPKEGSKAESIYNQFRSIMREICDDTMSDVDKARAIFEWIILNVQYDNAVAYPDTSTQIGQLASDSNTTYLFDAFYLEGVLRGSAVCDGISKAYSVMCAIEGIDCVRVTGERFDGGHAWNKIRLSGDWYLTDATWGNAYAQGPDNVLSEYILYKYFLFTDADRTRDGYGRQNYLYYLADTKFDEKNYYSSSKIEINNNTADFYIDSDAELSYLLDHIDVNFDALAIDGSSFEVMINPNVKIDGVAVSGITSNVISNLLSSAWDILYYRRGLLPSNRPKINVTSYFLFESSAVYEYTKVMFVFG
ncbi:MAG: hypothetical protein HDT32_05820 [Clostridiales bacterium]|nr:hypothetical protein [Clostridiales bacterium]